MEIDTPSGPLFSGSLGADNYGAYYTGQARATASLALNSPLGIGDRGSVWLAHSTGADAVFASYQVPVGYDGLTLGASASYYTYQLCCQFAALDRAGDAAVFGVQARYPLLLSQRAVMYAGLSLERKRLTDTWAGGDLDDKRVNVASLSLDGITMALAGQTRYRLALTGGDLDLKGPADYVKVNAATIDTAGRYAKLWGQVEYQQPLASWNFLTLRLSGQTASRNLDSSEKFLLGGFNGVRAYPEGEAAGDNAWLARLDWVIPRDRPPRFPARPPCAPSLTAARSGSSTTPVAASPTPAYRITTRCPAPGSDSTGRCRRASPSAPMPPPRSVTIPGVRPAATTPTARTATCAAGSARTGVF